MKKTILFAALTIVLIGPSVMAQNAATKMLPTHNNWHATYSYDKNLFFTTITNAILSGKLIAYSEYPNTKMTIKEFKESVFMSDSTTFSDPNNPEIVIYGPISELNKKFYQIRCNETVIVDPVTFKVRTKISSLTFYTYKYTESGAVAPNTMRKIFDVKLPD